MSNVTVAKRELEALRAEMRLLESEARIYRSLLMDISVIATAMDIKDASAIRRAITLAWSLKAAYDAVQVARMAAGDPIAWLGAGLTVGITAVNVGNVVSREMYGSEGPQ